jgi:hypothetical protein
MGSGDPSGLQNRRELALLALVSSTLTRFRQSLQSSSAAHLRTSGRFGLRIFGFRLGRCKCASISKPARVGQCYNRAHYV